MASFLSPSVNSPCKFAGEGRGIGISISSSSSEERRERELMVGKSSGSETNVSSSPAEQLFTSSRLGSDVLDEGVSISNEETGDAGVWTFLSE